MPRYFFHIRNGNGFTRDEEGRDLPGHEAARDVALRGIRSIVAEEAREGRLDLRGAIDVVGEADEALFSIPFDEALELSTGEPPPPESRPPGARSEIGAVLETHLGLIGDLSPGDAAALHTIRGDIREVARGEDLLRHGDRPSNAVAVLSGLLHRYTVSPQGRRQIHSFYIATDTPCFETLPIDYMDNALAATTRSRVAILPHSELFRVMEERPRLRDLIWRETLVQGAIVREWLMRNSQMLAHAQMAHFFCEMLVRARAAGIAEGEEMRLPLTQEDLADALGMTAVHVNRTLMMLRTGGLLEFRSGRLSVGDWDKLVEIAEFDPHYLHLPPQRQG